MITLGKVKLMKTLGITAKVLDTFEGGRALKNLQRHDETIQKTKIKTIQSPRRCDTAHLARQT